MILINQIKIMGALQKLNYGIYTSDIVFDLGEGIDESVKLLEEEKK